MADTGVNKTGLSTTELEKDLKAWYRDKLDTVFWRNSDFLKMITKLRVEGKEQRYPTLAGFGGAVSGRFKIAEKVSGDTVKMLEWAVKPGRLFDVFTMTTGDLLAAKSNKGAYMRIAGLKMFCASEAFRKLLGLALYGMGFGELCYVKPGVNSLTAGSTITLNIPTYAAIKLSVGSRVLVKNYIMASDVESEDTVNNVLVVEQIGAATSDGKIKIKFKSSGVTNFAANTIYVLSLLGCGDYYSSGDPTYTRARLPIGLDGWLPVVSGREDPADTTTQFGKLVNSSFYDVARASDVDGLCGSFYEEATANSSGTRPMYEIVLEVIRLCRNRGAQSDVIIMNDIDFANLQKETAPYAWLDGTLAQKPVANFGLESAAFTFRTTWVNRIIADPYCPRYKFYVLDSSTVEFWSYTGDNKIQDGVAPEATGKADPMSESGDNTINNNYNLLIDDYITVDAGSDTDDGPTARVTLQCMGTWVVTQTAVNGVGVFKDWADDEDAPIGYFKVVSA